MGSFQFRRVGVAAASLALVVFACGSADAATGVSGGGPVGQYTVRNGPISITVPAAATFQVGSKTAIWGAVGGCEVLAYTQALVGFSWHAKSSAGPIVSYTVEENSDYGLLEDDAFHFTSRTSGTQWINNYLSDDCGGGQPPHSWEIFATDSAGNTVQAQVNGALGATQFDNTAIDYGAGPGLFSYTGTWRISTCACADNGRQTYTTQPGATAIYTIPAANLTLGNHIALVMAKGPGRGYANVFIDGHYKATINTYAATNTNRVITWDSGPLTAANHVIKVVNLAAPGHPRIDINTVLSTSRDPLV